MPVQARIAFSLTEEGRRDSLRRGGGGRRLQEMVGMVPDADLSVFSVDEEGNASFDVTASITNIEAIEGFVFLEAAEFLLPTKARFVEGNIHWDEVPTWEELLQVSREVKKWRDAEESRAASYEINRSKAAQQFLADSAARATRVTERHVVVDAHWFENNEEVAIEARRRIAGDQEAARRANRVTLATWIQEHGTDNQRQRRKAGLLPWKEAYDALECYLYAPLKGFAPYDRFEIAEVCVCTQGVRCATALQGEV